MLRRPIFPSLGKSSSAEVGAVTSTEKVNWRLPADEWDAFRDYVYDKHGEIKGKLGDEVEQAMIEYIDADQWAVVERKVDRLISAAGRTPDDHAEIKSPSQSSGETVCARARVPPGVKEDFSAFVQQTDHRHGIIFTRALHERRSGGRADRVAQKLDRVLNDAESLLADANPDADEGVGPVERRTVAIIDRLRTNGEIGQLLDQDLEEAIRKQGLESDPSIDKYRNRVIDRLDYVTHRANPELWVPKGSKFAPDPDSPALDRKSYSNLSHEEKVRGLQIELARRASNSGRAQIGVDEARQEVFADQPSASHCRELMADAGDDPGYHWTLDHGHRRLKVDLDRVTDDVLEAASSNEPRGDWDDDKQDIESEMNRLVDAERSDRGDA